MASRTLEWKPHQTDQTASKAVDKYLYKLLTPASMMAFFIAGAFACVGNLHFRADVRGESTRFAAWLGHVWPLQESRENSQRPAEMLPNLKNIWLGSRIDEFT